MKVAFVGKGGSGKTTLSSLFIRHLASQDLPVVAIDADINQHLGVALGMSEGDADKVPALGVHLDEIKEYLRGDNPRITSAAEMVKTTPPGRGSRLLRMGVRTPSTRSHAASETTSSSWQRGTSRRRISGCPATTPRPAPWSCT